MQPPSKEPKEPKLRIVEVDRKIAAQLYDVWQDMKLRIQKETLTKTHIALSNQETVPSGLTNTASAHNHS